MIKLRDEMYTVQVEDGVGRLSIFNTNSEEFLNGSLNNENTYITNVTKIEFRLSLDEMNDLNNVLRVRYNNEVNVTELAICTGNDIDNIAYNTQIAFHVEIDMDTAFHLMVNEEISRSIDIGGAEIIDT